MHVLAGIDPKTHRCIIVGVNDAETTEAIRADNLIAVPVSKERARKLWGEDVADIYAIAEIAA